MPKDFDVELREIVERFMQKHTMQLTVLALDAGINYKRLRTWLRDPERVGMGMERPRRDKLVRYLRKYGEVVPKLATQRKRKGG